LLILAIYSRTDSHIKESFCSIIVWQHSLMKVNQQNSIF
jgi:hypothetical protein